MSRSCIPTLLILGTVSIASSRSPANEASQAERETGARRQQAQPLDSAASTPPPSRADAEHRDLPAADVLAEDAATANAAVESLRKAGPAGLAALLETHRDLLDGPLEIRDRTADPRWLRLMAALDAVGAQRNCDTSRLYWHTDLTAAVEAAR